MGMNSLHWIKNVTRYKIISPSVTCVGQKAWDISTYLIIPWAQGQQIKVIENGKRMEIRVSHSLLVFNSLDLWCVRSLIKILFKFRMSRRETIALSHSRYGPPGSSLLSSDFILIYLFVLLLFLLSLVIGDTYRVHW